MSRTTAQRCWVVAPALFVLLSTQPAAGESMVTPLATVRTDATTIVVGTLASSKAGLSVDVEYVIRGTATKGPRSIKDSPDGTVFVDQAPAKNRVLAFIDAKNRLRWVGHLQAGPTLETGVIRLEGFYNVNAHRVVPGLVTLPQLRSYLGSGKLDQLYRIRLVFADGKGGLRTSKRTVRVAYDALAHNSTVTGLSAACLGHGRLQANAWGGLSVFFHCRERARSLRLRGDFTGVDASTGEILATAAPTQPYLHEREFDRYLADKTATGVERLIEVSSQGKTWTWAPGKSMRSASGRVHSYRGATSSIRNTGPHRTTHETRRFHGGLELTVTGASAKPPWSNGSFFIHQIVGGQTYARCTLLVAGTKRSCKLKHLSPVWKHAKPYARSKTQQATLIQIAERFVIADGYTVKPPTTARANIRREAFEPLHVSDRLKRRNGTLESKAYGVSGSAKTGWLVIFRYRAKRGKNRPRHLGRAVSVDPYGRVLRIEHQDFVLKHARRLPAAP